MANLILTQGGLHMVIGGKPVTVAKSDKKFDEVVAAVKRQAPDEEIMMILEAEKRRMEAAVQLAPGIEIRGGQLYYNEEPIAGVLGDRMLQMIDEGFDLKPMVNFLVNLMQNPAKRVVDHLYDFLEYGKNPITDDGCFLAYKAVRADFRDIHSGTFDNSVGAVVKMARNRVDEDPTRTCSAGLHVCSYEYLPSFAHRDGHVVICKVNPAHVVAIPTDYNNTKMRVCEYSVVGEHEGYYKQEGDALSAASVGDASLTKTFVVEYHDGDEEYERSGSFARLSEAAERMDELLEDTAIAGVRIVNVKTELVIAEESNQNFEGTLGGLDFGDDQYIDEGFSLVGVNEGVRVTLESGIDSLTEAVQEALEYDAYDRIEIVDTQGNVVKTISG